jgi:hypothetical protein
MFHQCPKSCCSTHSGINHNHPIMALSLMTSSNHQDWGPLNLSLGFKDKQSFWVSTSNKFFKAYSFCPTCDWAWFTSSEFFHFLGVAYHLPFLALFKVLYLDVLVFRGVFLPSPTSYLLMVGFCFWLSGVCLWVWYFFVYLPIIKRF